MEKNQYLEEQYTNYDRWTKRTPTRENIILDHIHIVENETKKVSTDIDNRMHVGYGNSNREYYNIFGEQSLPGDAPIFVFVHGGYWRARSADFYGYLAVPIVKAGSIYISLEYDIAPNVTVTKIVEQIRRGVGQILQMAEKRKSKGVYLCGHSAGGHLVGMALADTQYQELFRKHVKGAMLISGLYDLRPILQTTINDDLHMTEAEACSQSVMPVVKTISQNCTDTELVFVVGGAESAESKRQSMECKQALETLGTKVKYIEVADEDHFQVAENMVNPDYQLAQEIRRLMGSQ